MIGPPQTDYVRVFNKTSNAVVWMDNDLESPTLEPMKWTDRVPAPLASRFGNNGDFGVDWNAGRKRRIMRPQPLYTDDGQMHLLLASPMDPATGYGYLSYKIADELGKRENLNLSMHPLAYWHVARTPRHIRDLMAQEQEVCEWALVVAIPTELPNVPARHSVLYSMWETAELPGHDRPGDPHGNWANLINNWAEAVIVPCEEQKEVFLAAGVTKPIYVVAIGLDSDTYYPNGAAKNDKFTIWTHGRLTSRKSPIEVLTEVVWPAIGHHDDWQLVFKTWAGALGGGKYKPVINDGRVVLLDSGHDPMPAEEMAHRMNQAHVGVYLSKYEGWGMPFREAMATGLVTLPSATSGHVVDCDPRYNFPVPILGTADAGDGYDGTWDLPDYRYARTCVAALYDAWKSGRWDEVKMGQEASQWIRQRRSWKQMIDGVLDVVNEVYEGVGG